MLSSLVTLREASSVDLGFGAAATSLGVNREGMSDALRSRGFWSKQRGPSDALRSRGCWSGGCVERVAELVDDDVVVVVGLGGFSDSFNVLRNPRPLSTRRCWPLCRALRPACMRASKSSLGTVVMQSISTLRLALDIALCMPPMTDAEVSSGDIVLCVSAILEATNAAMTAADTR